jgi:hypothetical protein
MILRGLENQSVLYKCLSADWAVVEIRNGESQEEAWRHDLTATRRTLGVRIRIFHYAKPGFCWLPSRRRSDNW